MPDSWRCFAYLTVDPAQAVPAGSAFWMKLDLKTSISRLLDDHTNGTTVLENLPTPSSSVSNQAATGGPASASASASASVWQNCLHIRLLISSV